jgi:hypothetical protein
MIKDYVGKWWSIPVPPTALDELSKSLPAAGEQNLTPEQKQIKDLIQTTKFFKDVKYVDDQQVGTESSAHYTAALDKDAFVAFVEKAAEIQGQKMTDTEKTDLVNGLNMVDFNGDMYIGKTSGSLNRVKGTLTIKQNAQTPAPTGTVSLDLSVTDLNKPVTVEVPKDAQPLPQDLLSGFGA